MKAWSESAEPQAVLSVDNDEVVYLLDFLTKKDLLERRVSMTGGNRQGPHAGTENYFEYIITPNGHAQLAELQARAVSSRQAFVPCATLYLTTFTRRLLSPVSGTLATKLSGSIARNTTIRSMTRLSLKFGGPAL